MQDILSLPINDNEAYLKSVIGVSNDIKYRKFVIPALNNCMGLIVCVDGISDAKEIEENILPPLITSTKAVEEEYEYNGGIAKKDFVKGLLCSVEIKELNQWTTICDEIMQGNTIILLDGELTALSITSKGGDKRAISEPVTETEIRGPRDGFIESIKTNATLIRKRIKDYSLRFEYLKMGDRTKTDIALVYIENLVNDALLQELKVRLGKIKIDGILGTGYIEELIKDNRYSPFPQVNYTERPDKASAAILEGKIVIIVDNTPFALIVPAVFWEFFQVSGDYYESFIQATFLRLIRFLAAFLAISLSSMYVLLSSYHQEMIPTSLALKMAAAREGVPFPAVIEAFFMEIMFEIFKEAGVRMPRPIGSTVSIVGTLVIGEAAVAAGIVGTTLVITIAASSVCSFAIPKYSMHTSLRLLRFPLLILSATFGLIGYLSGILAITMHLMSLRSFGAPYYAPVSPFRKSDNKDVLLRVPWWNMKQRPTVTGSKDRNRERENS